MAAGTGGGGRHRTGGKVGSASQRLIDHGDAQKLARESEQRHGRHQHQAKLHENRPSATLKDRNLLIRSCLMTIWTLTAHPTQA